MEITVKEQEIAYREYIDKSVGNKFNLLKLIILLYNSFFTIKVKKNRSLWRGFCPRYIDDFILL